MATFPAAIATFQTDAQLEGHNRDNIDGTGMDLTSWMDKVGAEIIAAQTAVGVTGSTASTSLVFKLAAQVQALADHIANADPHTYAPIELQWTGSAYPTRPTTSKSVIYVGPVQPNGTNSPGGPVSGDRYDSQVVAAQVREIVPVVFFIPAPTAGAGTAHFKVRGPWTIKEVELYADTAPTGADLVIDVNRDTGSGPTTIWSTQANRAKIVAGQKTGTATTFNTTSLSDNHILTVDIDQIDSGHTAANVTVVVWLEDAS